MQLSTLSSVVSLGFPPRLLHLEYTSEIDGAKDDAMILPPAHGNIWIVCLHGFAGKSNQLFVRSDIKQHWLPEYLKRGYGILSPGLRGDAWMNDESMVDLQALLCYIRQEYGAQRFIFSSGSMGATSSLIYACHHPEDVNGLDLHGAVSSMADYYDFCAKSTIPMIRQICSSLEAAYGGTPDEVPYMYSKCSALNYANILATIPFFQIHGTADEVMPVSQGRRLAGALAESSCYAYVEIPGGDHNAPLRMEAEIVQGFANPLDWIQQKLQ